MALIYLNKSEIRPSLKNAFSIFFKSFRHLKALIKAGSKKKFHFYIYRNLNLVSKQYLCVCYH